MQRINIVDKGRGNWRMTKPKNGKSSGTFEVKLYPIIFFKISKKIFCFSFIYVLVCDFIFRAFSK